MLEDRYLHFWQQLTFSCVGCLGDLSYLLEWHVYFFLIFFLIFKYSFLFRNGKKNPFIAAGNVDDLT